jgi:hypothetical protein
MYESQIDDDIKNVLLSFKANVIYKIELFRGLNLDNILCIRTERTLRNGSTIAYNGKLYQNLICFFPAIFAE